MDLCDERNSSFAWEETRPKKYVMSYTPTDERRKAPPASQYDEDRRHRLYSAEHQEDQLRRRFREHQRSGGGLWKRDIIQIELKFCTGCADTKAGLHAANLRPESLEEATTYILQYQFNHAAVYGRREDRSPEPAVRSVRSRRDYSEERSPPRREYKGRDVTLDRSRTERPQNQREIVDLGEWRNSSPRQDKPPFKPPQERREDSHPQEILDPNGIDSPRQPQKVVNPNALDPPNQLKQKGKLELAVSDEDTSMQHQVIAIGGERSIICSGVRNVQGQEAVPAYTIIADVGNVSVDAMVNFAAKIPVISEEIYRRLIPKQRLSGSTVSGWHVKASHPGLT
ncbi:hypothetical protein PoB_006665400 [Plakobranchus ocellatus]|uniref:Uncharacterized protein n=1 Tax=Plakobranchus ocellatus TaxID=259542 RepID=A0AAV4D7G4_9GAST|nr:hypothetical protein PoB_006665400 [Plakobranchus ocellatus]